MQTHEGLIVTSKSLIQCVRFLLNAGMKYVLTDIFSQDRLENCFGKQRSIGRRNGNPKQLDIMII